MTDEEFDVLDELYFVISYNDLVRALVIDETKLVEVLNSLHQRDFIKVLSNADDEVDDNDVDLAQKANTYFYLITKKGLLAHNSN